MPGIPLVARETTCSRGADQMCRQGSRLHLSAEEEAAAEESLSIYCKPVELYNILRRRAIRNPLFLQRCLRYKIQAKHKKRIEMTVSLAASVNNGLQIQSLFPFYIMLARTESNFSAAEQSACYHFKRCFTLSACAGDEGTSQVQARFVLPEFNKLSGDIKCGSLAILFISSVEPVRNRMDFASFQTQGGHCMLGKIPMELLHLSWAKSPNLSLGERSETILTVDLHPCVIKSRCVDGDGCISFQAAPITASLATAEQLKVIFIAEEVGAKDRSPYESYSYNDIPPSLLPHIMRLRTGNVVFDYKYYNNKLQRTEVTEDFSCPFCLVKCASFKGLRFHLSSSHDLFNFEFWVTEEYQAVNVSVRTDAWRSEIVADGIDPKQQIFFFCSNPHRWRKPKNIFSSVKHVHPLVLESDFLMKTNGLHDAIDAIVEPDASSPTTSRVFSATAPSYADPECTNPVPGSSIATPMMLQFAKSRKLSVERSRRALLQKWQFFHSHRAQPMALEQVLSDRDSEDEVDDDVADLEDRRMLDDFVDVSKDEKQMMHLWNSFVRKQRVLADGHLPWACEAFTQMHAADLVQAPALSWCWRIFMIKLWNHGLLDARSMNNCNIILEQWRNQDIHSLKSDDGVE